MPLLGRGRGFPLARKRGKNKAFCDLTPVSLFFLWLHILDAFLLCGANHRFLNKSPSPCGMSYFPIFLHLGNEYPPLFFLQLNKHSVLVVFLAVLCLHPNPPNTGSLILWESFLCSLDVFQSMRALYCTGLVTCLLVLSFEGRELKSVLDEWIISIYHGPISAIHVLPHLSLTQP